MTSDINILFDRFEKFLVQTYYIIAPSIHDCINRRFTKRRVKIAILLRLIALLTAIRYGLSVIFDSPFILWLTSDANHTYVTGGVGGLLSLLYSNIAFVLNLTTIYINS